MNEQEKAVARRIIAELERVAAEDATSIPDSRGLLYAVGIIEGMIENK